MQFVYILMGLGFGDDEAVWEICDVYATPQAAAAAQKASQEATGLPSDSYSIRVQPVLLQ